MSKFFSSKITQNVLLPLTGFAAGWGIYQAADSQLLSDDSRRKISLLNLKTIRGVQSILPASVSEQYGYPERVLNSMIASMEKGYSEMEMSERVTFDEVLRECDVSEQICYLEEHATEDIPYFYIADVFHSWASINSKYYLKEEDGSSSVTQVNKKDFESPVLCKELWEKMKNGVIPFDVSVRALCLLAATNKKNARQIAANVRADPNDMLQLYTTYIHSLEEKGLPEGDTVPLADVAGSTLFLLKMSNDASSGFLGLRRGSLTQGVDRDLWCGNFGVLPSAVRNRTADTASAFAEALSEKLKCPVDK